MTMQARFLSLGAAVIFVFIAVVAMQRIGSSVPLNLLVLGLAACVAVQATIQLGRRLAGATSSYPADWTPRRDRLERLARVGIALVVVIAWAVVAYAVYRGVDFTLGQGLGVVIQALSATTFVLISLGPTDWSKSRSWQVHLMTIIALTMGLAATMSGLAKLPG